MPFSDLRQYIDKLESEGELQRINAEVDWRLEMGAVSRRAMDLRTRAPLFELIKDYPNSRVLALPCGPTQPIIQGRVSLSLGLPKKNPVLSTIDEFRKRLDQPIDPTEVTYGSCKENIQTGEMVNLLKFPVPLIHDGDGGRYIGTWHICVTKDPDTGWVNWGMYRVMMVSKNKAAINLNPTQHGGNIFFEKFERRGKAMPIAVAIGTEPVTSIVACTPLPFGADHAKVAGGLRESPVELVKCETSDLFVPASAEIVIEGHVVPKERETEGPFGEYAGYFAGGKGLKPVIDVDCITHRNQPILTMTNMGKPWHESDIVEGVTKSAMAKKLLEEKNIPVKSTYCFPGYLLVISARSAPGLLPKIVSTLKSARSRTHSYYTLIVGEDVDITNLEEVIWSLTTRMNPKTGIYVETNLGINALVPFLTPEEREGRYSSKAYFDATFPANWSKQYLSEHTKVVNFNEAWPKDIQDKVIERWSNYGYT